MADLIKKLKEWLMVALGSIGAFLLLLLGIKNRKNEKLKEEVSDLKTKVDEGQIRIEKEEKKSEVIAETSRKIQEKKAEVVEEVVNLPKEPEELRTTYNEFINKWNR